MENNKKLVTAGVIFLGFASLFLFIRSIGAVRAWHGSDASVKDKPTITVAGTGEISAKPDLATFTYTVTESGATTAEAQAAATAKSNKVLAYLKTQKIDDKDIKTLSYNTN